MQSFRQHARFVFTAAIIVVSPSVVIGQADSAAIRGIVVAPDGHPVEGANVFLLETLDGVLTSANGKFSISASRGALTVVVRKLGYAPQTIAVASRSEILTVRLVRAAPVLTPMTVLAGRYTANEERTSTLTSLEVVTTPGAAADVNRALQTLPGIQQVDEGTGLFVRGGDYTETKVFLNESSMLNPLDIQSPSGTFMGSVDPFILDGIVFSSGGFGARFGNALSAAVDLHTQGIARRRAFSGSLGLAGVSMSLAQPVSSNVGVRAATNLFDLRPLIAVNGSSTKYDPAPRGHDLSGSVVFDSPGSGTLTLFAIDKTENLGVGVDDPAYSGTFHLTNQSRMGLATWHALFGSFAPTVSAGLGSVKKDEEYGTFLVRTRLDHRQLFAQTVWNGPGEMSVRGGVEVENVQAAFDGSIPNTANDVAPGSRTRVVESNASGLRSAVFIENDMRIGERVRFIAGSRSDHSSLTNETTFDPRVSAAVRTVKSATLTAAWGIYHELPDPLLFDPTLGDPALKSMRATHSILGIQAGDNTRMIRVELYDKQYSSLSMQTRDYTVASHGTGNSRGADLFLKGTPFFGIRARLTYSYVHSRRTDANTGLMASAPFDVPHTVTFIAQKTLGNWEIGSAYRYSSGRPFTPVTGATFSKGEGRWIPVYGTPFSERLPVLTRIDLSISKLQMISSSWRAVMYASVNNTLARHNVYSYTYSADFTRRIPVPSLFDRSLYVGATILH